MNNKPFVRLHLQQVNAGKHSFSNNPLICSITLQQSGAVLIISLIMLLLLTLIGASSMQTTSLEEKMAGNLRDRNLAFQAAESALRDAEQDIRGIGTTPRNPPISGISDFYHTCNMDSLANTYDDGLCDRKWTSPSSYGVNTIEWPPFTTTAGTPYLKLIVDMTTTANDGKSVAYGRFTGAAAITGLSAQPRYLIEGYRSNANTYYRITVRAQGASANTVVWLQTVYKQ